MTLTARRAKPSRGKGFIRVQTLEVTNHPGLAADEIPFIKCFTHLPQMPDISLVVLDEEGQLLLLHLAVTDVHVVDHNRRNPLDDLDEIGNRVNDAVGNPLAALDRVALVDELLPRRKRYYPTFPR